MQYHTNDDLADATHRYAERAARRVVVREIGLTSGGRRIIAVSIAALGRSPDRSRPQALVTANIHGNEVISSEAALHLLGLLTADALQEDALRLLDLADVTVVPAINLDAREKAAAALSLGRSGGRASRCNARGVDLNRNFPTPAEARDAWHPLAGSRFRCFPWYRGEGPLSEPETRGVSALADELRPLTAINLHSVGRLFLYPYCAIPREPPDLAVFRAMGKAFVDAQPHRAYRIKQSRTWYTILGDMDDWLYCTYGTLAVTIELSAPFTGWAKLPLHWFSSTALMNPRDPTRVLENTGAACLRALQVGVRHRLANGGFSPHAQPHNDHRL